MTDRATALVLLRRQLDDDRADFRPGQWEAIDSIVNDRARLLVVQRTGWGKSSVYFIATRMLRDLGRGPTLIVSPLLALMRNQIAAAERLGIRAVTINSTNREEWRTVQRAVLDGEADAMLVSPERLANDGFVDDVLLPVSARIGLLVVDEAHCISDWGHDFRPDYRRLVNVLQRMPGNLPVLGTTATANDRVIEDAQAQLGRTVVQRGPLMRDTLVLQTLRLPTQAERLAWLADNVNELPGTGIIYALTRRDAEQVSAWLNLCAGDPGELVARPYYSGVTHDDHADSNAYRRHLELALDRNQLKALVATSALGMGYDKPDLGFVVHYQAPGSIVAYYQQVGRAGRGVERALGILMSGAEDAEIHEYFRNAAFPREEWVAAVLEALEASDGLTVRELEASVNLRQGQIEQVVKILSVDNPAPLTKDDGKWRRTAVAYQMDHERIQRLTRQREAEWMEVQSYIDGQGCLMAFLAEALDDPDPQPRGRCASCRGMPILEPTYSRERVVAATRFLRQADMPLHCRKRVRNGHLPTYGFSGSLSGTLDAGEGRILSRWADAGWGGAVLRDKGRGRFRDELVDAVAEMVRDRWRPEPLPQWITCVPSHEHPTLVPDFAERLAAALGRPFAPVVVKLRRNEPQKDQQNTAHRCRNLDGVFEIRGDLLDGSVLLVDDVVDSGWTLTVVAALLRRAGCGLVWPVALATSNPGA
ncbi:MAG: DEAD/DEAH box helicase [Acidobacteria bacterium]|nr:DEAD/DEAH box helicase [Acidobacteriota bacterium]